MNTSQSQSSPQLPPPLSLDAPKRQKISAIKNSRIKPVDPETNDLISKFLASPIESPLENLFTTPEILTRAPSPAYQAVFGRSEPVFSSSSGSSQINFKPQDSGNNDLKIITHTRPIYVRAQDLMKVSPVLLEKLRDRKLKSFNIQDSYENVTEWLSTLGETSETLGETSVVRITVNNLHKVMRLCFRYETHIGKCMDIINTSENITMDIMMVIYTTEEFRKYGSRIITSNRLDLDIYKDAMYAQLPQQFHVEHIQHLMSNNMCPSQQVKDQIIKYDKLLLDTRNTMITRNHHAQIVGELNMQIADLRRDMTQLCRVFTSLKIPRSTQISVAHLMDKYR